MSKRILVLIFTVLVISLKYTAIHAQYKRVTYPSGIQPFDNNNVTVSYTGPSPSFSGFYNCGIGPYWIGFYVNAFFIQFTSPYSYTFNFSNIVDHIRIECSSLYNTDSINVYINGAPYLLTNAHLFPLPFPASCRTNNLNATIVSGVMTGILPPSFSGPVSDGKLIIKETGISSVTVEWSGVLMTNGQSGSMISVYFGQISAANNGPVCPGDSLQLWGDTTITEPGTFHWKGPNGYTAQEQNPVIYPFTHQDTGIYTLTYITGGVDTFTDTTHVTILSGPLFPTISADSPVCAGTTLYLSAVATVVATYSWSGPNGFTASGASVSIPDVQVSNAGIYTVTASLGGCHPKSTKDIMITQPVINNFTELVCSNIGYDFNGRYLNESGIYTDTYPGSNGCDSVNRLNLIVLPGPKITASFSYTDGQLCLGDTVMLHAAGNAADYTWYTGNNNTIGSGTQLPFVLQYTDNRVTLTGSGADNGCIDTFTINIPAEGCCALLIPNAFSPNGDGINDVFIPITNGYFDNYRMDIFNRWGQRIFSANGMEGWDGYHNAKPADAGTYYYHIIADCLEGEGLKKKGELVLIR